MPDVKKGEKEQEYVSRCIPILISEGKSEKQAAAICYSMYKQKKGKPGKKEMLSPTYMKSLEKKPVIGRK